MLPNSRQDWLQVDSNIGTKPEIRRIRRETGTEAAVIVGRIVLFWCLVDQHGSSLGPTERPAGRDDLDGIIPDYQIADLIDEIGGDWQFWWAVVSTGWLYETPSGLLIPGFSRRFSLCSKERANATVRKQRQRWRDGGGLMVNGSSLIDQAENRLPPLLHQPSTINHQPDPLLQRLLALGVTAPHVLPAARQLLTDEQIAAILDHAEKDSPIETPDGLLRPRPPGVIVNRLTQSGRAQLPPGEGWPPLDPDWQVARRKQKEQRQRERAQRESSEEQARKQSEREADAQRVEKWRATIEAMPREELKSRLAPAPLLAEKAMRDGACPAVLRAVAKMLEAGS